MGSSAAIHFGTTLEPQPHDLGGLSLGPSPAEPMITELMQRDAGVPDGWQPTGRDLTRCLPLMERIVQTIAPCVDERGAVIDPVEQFEHGQTTSRFASSGAIVHAHGLAMEALSATCRAMSHACRRLGTGDADSPDFQMRELVTALGCLEQLGDAVSDDLLRQWRDDLRRVAPERHYRKVEGPDRPIETLNNWVVYACGGEWLREAAGIGASHDGLWGQGFFDKYMEHQRAHFTEHGMYRDPHDPITYDFVTRLQIAVALASGYDGPWHAEYSELLRRGGLATLLWVSPDGFSPFGGRSNQFHFQEAAIAALCEIEARRYATSDPRLAGAFKRQARLSIASIERWLLGLEPMRHLKNGFDPQQRWGLEGYARYSVYALYAASCLGLAMMFADDSIEETPCPAERGGYVLELSGAFHKVFASTRTSQMQIDTAGQGGYDATGLGRFHVRGVPPELGLSMPLASEPHYHLPDDAVPDRSTTIGPEWRFEDGWHPLAAAEQGVTCRVETTQRDADRVAFALQWHHDAAGLEIDQRYTLTTDTLTLDTSLRRADGNAAPAWRLVVPLLVTDGDATSQFAKGSGRVTVRYRGAQLEVMFDEARAYTIEPEPVGNRNGLYHRLLIDAVAANERVTLRLSPVAS